MKKAVKILLFLVPITLAAKFDPLAGIAEPEHTLLKKSIERYAKDEIAQNWADLYEIADQDGTKARDDRFTESTTALTREAFVDAIRQDVANGGTPVLTSFELTEIKPERDGYDIQACAGAKRETFHFKGIIRFHATIHNGTVRFAPWSYFVSMPHSCSKKSDE